MNALSRQLMAPLSFVWACSGLFAQDEVSEAETFSQLQRVIQGEVAQTRLEAYQKAALSVATVERTTKEGTEIGCGFFVDDAGTFVTVLSTAGETLQMTVKYGGNKFLPKLLTVDPYTRLAVLKLDGIKPPGLDLVSSRKLDVGDYAIAVAETEKDGNRCTIGRLAGREKSFDGVPLAATLLRLNLKAKPGSFGAPLVSVGGQVAGVILLSVTGEDGVCYALPSELIEKVLLDYERHGRVQPCWMGIGLAQGTTTPAIVSLSEDSPAKTAGLKPGDVIRQIGRRPIREYQDVVDACYYLIAEEPVTITVMRQLEDLKIVVTPSIATGYETGRPAAVEVIAPGDETEDAE